MKKRNGFTLVEILIVVVILGILAAIVIPQFSDASTEAKLSSLVSDLQTVRSQIQLYKIQHTDALPTAGGLTFAVAMTSYTTVAGVLATTQAPGVGVYGPYLQQIPKNPFNDFSTVTEGATTPASATGLTGWYFNTTTGAFNADDSVTATPAHNTL
ncbi:MAG: prepilin-type N-terminal cleavage/methylation domain-containing protein [Phycisphaerae bacterium]|nr:prepilin-type N-terminal cleavage/methylation domain-containing protein [Phycisphaerae bacterium]